MEHKEENFLILEVFEKVVKHSQIISLMYLLNQTCVFINLFDGNYFNKMMMILCAWELNHQAALEPYRLT